MLSEAVGRPVDLAAAVTLLAERAADFQHEVRVVTEHLAIAIAAVINIFNPTALFVHGRLLASNPERFERVLDRVKQRTLTAALADCAIHATRSSKRQGAVAGIIHQLTSACAPTLG
jgi:N-acetylglucosamine repressor